MAGQQLCPVFARYDARQNHLCAAQDAFQGINAETVFQQAWEADGDGLSLRLVQQIVNLWQPLGSHPVGQETVVADHAETFVRNMLEQAHKKFLLLADKTIPLFGSVIEVFKRDHLAVVVLEPGHGQGWALQVTAQVFDVFVVIFVGLGKVNDPVLLVLLIQPLVKLG